MLRRVARPHDADPGPVAGLAGMHDIDDYPQARLTPGLLVYRYDSPLFFANAQDFRRRALAAADEQGAAALVRAERRGQCRGRHHRAGRRRGAPRRARRPRHRLRLGPGQAGPARPLDATGSPTGSARPALPDAADRRAAYRAGRASRPAAGTAPRRQTPSRTRGLTHRPTTETCPRAIATGSCTTYRRASRPGRVTNPPAALLLSGGRVKSSQSRAHADPGVVGRRVMRVAGHRSLGSSWRRTVIFGTTLPSDEADAYRAGQRR